MRILDGEFTEGDAVEVDGSREGFILRNAESAVEVVEGELVQ